MKFIDIYENQADSTVVLPIDSVLRVVLEENPSTGYRWQLEDKSSSCLKVISNDFFSKNDSAVGAAGVVVFYFKPVKPGRCMLFFKLWRSWEGDKSIINRFRIGVSINTNKVAPPQRKSFRL